MEITKSGIKVSIITPSYNQGQFIEETILSVLNQSYKNIEYILIDGGSTDNTMQIVDKYKDRIDIVVHERDKGQSDAINKGFKLATGKLVGWINSDDVLYSDCVEKIVDVYNLNTDGSIYYGNTINCIDAKGHIFKTKSYNIMNLEYLLNENFDVIQPGSFYSNDILREVNYVDESIHYCMDLDLWIRLLKHGKIYSFSGHPIAAIRKWEGTKTSTGVISFLSEIKTCIFKHGGKKSSKNTRRILLESMKGKAKRLLK